MKHNELIAEFMGIEEAYNPNGNDWVLKKTTPDINGDTDILECCKSNDLKYHSSWDWLMPVVEKIYSIDADIDFFKNISLEDTYKAVVQFINNIKTI